MKKILSFFLILTIIGCEEKSSKKAEIKKDTFIETKTEKIDFLDSCPDFVIGQGKLQGIFDLVSADSLPIIIYGECINGSNSFEVIFAPKMDLHEWKQKVNEDSFVTFFENDKKNGFPNFDCYLFKVPMIKPELLKEEHDLNIKFPTNIKILVKSYNTDWKEINKKTIKDFEEYSFEKFKAFYRQL